MKEEKEAERLKLKQIKDDFESYLQNCEHMNSTIKYKKKLNNYLDIYKFGQLYLNVKDENYMKMLLII